MTTTKISTKELIHQVAMDNGWQLVKDLGWSREYHRGEHGEYISLYFGETSGAITLATHRYPTGDLYVASYLRGDTPSPVYAWQGMDHREKGKKAAVLRWLAEPRYAKPGINADLRKLGIAPLLPDAPEA